MSLFALPRPVLADLAILTISAILTVLAVLAILTFLAIAAVSAFTAVLAVLAILDTLAITYKVMYTEILSDNSRDIRNVMEGTKQKPKTG